MPQGLLAIFGIILGTFVSEDLTILTAGLLVTEGKLDLWEAFLGSFIGIFLGDIGLFTMGFVLRRFPDWLSRHPLFSRYFLKASSLDDIRRKLEANAWKLLFLSRFVPGSRFLVYTGAGALGGRFVTMLWVAFVAGAVWTPLLLFASIHYGPLALKYFSYISGPGLSALLLSILSLLLLHQLLFSILTQQGRKNWKRRLGTLKHPEFWPLPLFYAPLPFMILRLSIRHKGLNVFTAANPGISAGGFIDESKAEILRHFPRQASLPYFLSEPGPKQAEYIIKAIKRKKWKFPLILKPDRSQKGIGLKLVKNEANIIAYCSSNQKSLIVQKYHPGPYEAGIFYYRFPKQREGHILSITNKVFPVIEGDGMHTIEELIWRHERYFLQAPVFLKRFEGKLSWIPRRGEKIRLGLAGNHLQGCLFLRANDWITPSLSKRIDQISQKISKSMGGFYFGRFDVRYTCLEKLKAGKELCLIELNGATSESTDMYDPNLGILEVYRTMWRTLSLLYAIGDANRRQGIGTPTPLRELLQMLWNYRKKRGRELVSD